MHAHTHACPRTHACALARAHARSHVPAHTHAHSLAHTLNSLCFADCELVALLEDDTGMELLVCNKIVSLDLPVKDVFKKIWCVHSNVRTTYCTLKFGGHFKLFLSSLSFPLTSLAAWGVYESGVQNERSPR